MKLERIRISGLRAIRSLDVRLADGDQVWRSFCIRGVNGSGKTTCLEAIAQMWGEFRSNLSREKVAIGKGNALLYEGSEVELVLSNMPRFNDAPGFQKSISFKTTPTPSFSTSPLNRFWWLASFMISESGSDASMLPNIVYLEAENRWSPEPRANDINKPAHSAPWQAVCRYSPQARGADHIEGVMRTLKLARPEKWSLLREVVADLFPGLALSDDFDEATQRPLFRLQDGRPLFFTHLSAGERAVLINLCTVLRWLAPGGIVLLDEPELHQHLSLMRGSLAAMEWLVCDRLDGQLLVVSHAPEVWDHFRASGHIIELPGREIGAREIGASRA